MLNVRLLCVGKLKEKFYKDACAEYEKRLGGLCRIEVTELPELASGAQPLEREADALLEKIPKDAYCIAMCIEGELCSSEQLAARFCAVQQNHSRICVVIGSSEGLSPRVKARAQLRLSMSPMTFPHHLARVMVLEQIYRALSIAAGGKYHK